MAEGPLIMVERLEDRIVRALPAPASGNKLYYDSEVKGFAVRVTAAGARAFVLNYRAGGRERRYTIGSYPDWSTTAARNEAKDLKKRIDKGEDPMGERHEERATPTVGDLIDRFKRDYLPKKRASTAEDYTFILERIIRPELGKVKVADLRHAEVDQLHRDVTKERGPYRANRAAAVLSKLFTFAMKMELAETNPVKGLEKNPEDRRQRFLSGAELAALSAALAEQRDQQSANAIRLLMLTGARSGEVLSARWDQFDLAAGVWTKPSSHTKQKKEHRVPLSAPAVALLTAIKEAAGREVFVFPGDGEGDHLGNVKRTWASAVERATVILWSSDPASPAGKLVARLQAAKEAEAKSRRRKVRPPTVAECQAAARAERVELPGGLLDVRIHDLRHSYASILAAAGMSLPIIGALLGHTQPATTARYAHLADDPLRQATERVGAILEAVKAPKTADVVSMRKGK